jgi:alkylresorcinol/alkylpyrone synthase
MARQDVKQTIQHVFSLESRKLAAVLAIIDNAEIEQRYSAFPLDYLAQPRSLTETSLEYQEHAVGLGRQVTMDCLAQAGIASSEVDLLVTVSCTGYMIPSLDAYLINALGFRPDVRRLPITELGCIAGAMALSRAYEYVLAYPAANALVVAVELPSLTLQRNDHSQANLVSCALFGDGAAATLITGRDTRGARILDTASCLVPDTLDAMGFDLRDDGFHMVLSREVPRILRDQVGDLTRSFLKSHGLYPEEIGACVLHPGGRKILDYLEEELGITREQTQPSWDVLRDYGNLSSATILFVLREWMTQRAAAPGTYGLVAGFGPGLSVELLLVQWV